MSRAKKIVFDVDGVILDVPSKRADIARQDFGLELKEEEKAPPIFKKKHQDIYKELSHKLYRSSDIEVYPEARGILERLLLENGAEFILLSERRSDEEEAAERGNLRNSGIGKMIGNERIEIVRQTVDKIPVIQAFGVGGDLWIIDDGIDKIRKFLDAGVEANMVWFNEFGIHKNEEIPGGVNVVSTHQELAGILL